MQKNVNFLRMIVNLTKFPDAICYSYRQTLCDLLTRTDQTFSLNCFIQIVFLSRVCSETSFSCCFLSAELQRLDSWEVTKCLNVFVFCSRSHFPTNCAHSRNIYPVVTVVSFRIGLFVSPPCLIGCRVHFCLTGKF